MMQHEQDTSRTPAQDRLHARNLRWRAQIQGTRLPVRWVVAMTRAGVEYDEFLSEYDLTRRQVDAALEYAMQAGIDG